MFRRTSCHYGRDVAAKTTSLKGGGGERGLPCGVLTLHRTYSQATTRRTGLALDDRATCPWRHGVGCRGCAGTTARNSHGHPAAANVSISVCFLGPWFHLLFLQCCTYETWLENIPQKSTTVMRRVSMNGNVAQASALQGKQVTTTLKKCQRNVKDYVATCSLQLKLLGSTPSTKLPTVHPRGIDTLIWHMR